MLKWFIALWNCILTTIWGYLAYINEAHAHSPHKTGLEASALIAGPLLLNLISSSFVNKESKFPVGFVTFLSISSFLLLLCFGKKETLGWIMYLVALPIHIIGPIIIFLVYLTKYSGSSHQRNRQKGHE